jgi:hypothetical protein
MSRDITPTQIQAPVFFMTRLRANLRIGMGVCDPCLWRYIPGHNTDTDPNACLLHSRPFSVSS